MADYVIMPKADYQGILDATREKTGTSDLLLSNEVADKIRSISTGGSDAETATLTISFGCAKPSYEGYFIAIMSTSGFYAVGEDPLFSEGAVSFDGAISVAVKNIPIGAVVNIALVDMVTACSYEVGCSASTTTFSGDEGDYNGFAITVTDYDASILLFNDM